MERSPAFYFWCYLITSLAGFTLGVLPLVSGVVPQGRQEREILIGVLVWFTSQLIFSLFLYDIWKVLPRRFARTTPAAAVVFLFVPVFNLYWVFPAIRGWTSDYNYYVLSLHRGKPPVPVGLASFVAIATALGVPMTILWLLLPHELAVALLGCLLPAYILATTVFIRKAGETVRLVTQEARRKLSIGWILRPLGLVLACLMIIISLGGSAILGEFLSATARGMRSLTSSSQNSGVKP